MQDIGFLNKKKNEFSQIWNMIYPIWYGITEIL